MLQNSKLENLYSKIIKLKKYKPSKVVNKLFTELVGEAINSDNLITLSSNQLNRLQKICSLSEFEMELYWARKIISSKNPDLTLSKFPYIDNYKKLTKMEWFSLLGCTNHNSHNILFVGGGPLPLTAILLSLDFGMNVTILEKDKSASYISKKLIEKLRLDSSIKVIHQDATKYLDYSNYNIIIVAALAGADSNTKRIILKRINRYIKTGSHIVARSSWGMRKILYRPIDRDAFSMFKTVIEVRPHNDVVNSVVIFSK